MKHQFLIAMKVFCDRGPADLHQLRVMVRVFAAGWIAAIRDRGEQAEADLQALCDQIADHNWWPDPSWNWAE